MTEQAKKYQITLIFPPSFNQEALDQAVQKAKKLITDQGGSFSKDLEPTAQLKKLSYPINKHDEAFYLTFNDVSLSGQIIEPLKQQLNLNNDLIRYLITGQLKVKEKTESIIDYNKVIEKIEPMPQAEKSPISIESYPSQKQEGQAPVEKPAPQRETKTQIEDLDKKLEEILNE